MRSRFESVVTLPTDERVVELLESDCRGQAGNFIHVRRADLVKQTRA